MSNFLQTFSLPLLLGLLLAASSSHAQLSSGNYYENARQRFDGGDAQGALIQLKNALQRDPQHVPSLVLSGEVYLEINQPAAAEDALSEALLLGADKSYVVLKLAQAYQRQGKYLNLIHDLPLENFSGVARVDLLAYHGDAYLGLGRLKEAQRVLDEAAKLDPTALLPKLARVVMYIRQGDLARAQQVSERMLDLAPDDSRVWSAHASVLHAQGRLQDTLSFYSKAIALDRDNVDARVAQIGLRLDLGQEYEAMEDLEYLRENFPGEPRAAYLRGVVLDRSGDRGAAQQALRKCTDLIASLGSDVIARDTQLSMSASLAHFGLGEFERARSYLERHLSHNPANLGASRLLASVLIELRATDAAIKLLRPQLRENSSDLQLMSLMASAYSQAGRHEQSIKLLQTLQRRDSANPEIGERLALTRLEAGQQALAIDALKQLFGKDPGNAVVGFALNYAYINSRQYNAAIEVARSFVARDPGNLSYQNLLGLSYYFAAQYDAAAVVFDAMLATDREFLPAHINLVRVKIAQGHYAAARRRLNGLFGVWPENATLMLQQARLERLEGALVEARRWGENAQRAQPDELEYRIFLTELYLQMGESAAAEKLARDSVSVLNNDLGAMAILGQVLVRLDQPKEALVVYGRMEKLVGFDPQPLYKIALLQIDQKAYREAQHTLYKALEAKPDYLEATRAIVDVHLALEEYDKVLTLAAEAMEKFPGEHYWQALRGAAYLRLGNFPEAEKAYQLALTRSAHPDYTIGLYRALLQQKKRESAEKVLRASLEEHPDVIVLKVALAEFLLSEERWQEGKTLLLALLRQLPGHPQLLNNLANVKFQLREDDALDVARRAHLADSSDPRINDTLGWLLVQNNNAEEGLLYLREATTRSANEPEIRYHLAVALHTVGREIEARRELKVALLNATQPAWRAAAESLQASLQ